MSGSGMGTAALVIIGIILVVIAILSGNPLPLAILGVAAIGLGAILEAWVRRAKT